ncbi:MAG: hypothetical protein DWQ29_03590, partial [Planctomycetota bacterium]
MTPSRTLGDTDLQTSLHAFFRRTPVRRPASVFLASTVLLAFLGCGGSGSAPETADNSAPAEAPQSTDADPQPELPKLDPADLDSPEGRIAEITRLRTLPDA